MAIDPATLAVGAGLYVAAAIARQIEDDVLGEVWRRTRLGLKRLLGREAVPADATPERLRQLADDDPALADTLGDLWRATSVLRRAQLVRDALRGARVLWVDDFPAGNTLERECLTALGINLVTVESTRAALACLGTQPFDLIISDINREGSSRRGLDALREIRNVVADLPIIFYIMHVEDRGVPAGAFGITASPDELLHLCMDALERRRV